MAEPHYERYARLVSSIVADVLSLRTREVVIFGGRGLGKSTVADALKKRFDSSVELNPVYAVSGRAAAAAAAPLRAVIDASQKGSVIADDADHLLEHTEARGLFAQLLQSRDWQDPQRTCVVMTAENVARLQDLASADDPSSVFVQKATSKHLDPWLGNWQSSVREAVTAVLHRRTNSAEAIDAWSTIVAEETGGHPALVARALDIVHGLIEQDPESLPDTPERVRGYLAPHLEPHATALATKALEHYRSKRPHDFRGLIAVAADPGSTSVPFSALQTGLAYSRTDDGMTVVDGLVRQALARMVPGDRVDIRPAPDEPDKRGDIMRIRDGKMIATVALSESLWRILEKLRAANGEIVPTAALMDCVGSNSDAALTSALQRLRISLEKVGLQSALQNVRTLGYRWDPTLAREGPTRGLAPFSKGRPE